jgi:hypothetical protein
MLMGDKISRPQQGSDAIPVPKAQPASGLAGGSVPA